MKLTFEVEQGENGVWSVTCQNKHVIAASPADALLPLLEAMGLDNMASHVVELRRVNDMLETQLAILKADYQGLLSYIAELQGRTMRITQATGSEKDNLLNKLEKMLAPWPPRRSASN